MSPIRNHITLDHHTTTRLRNGEEALDRSEKTRGFLGEVLPAALNLGVQGLQGLAAKQTKHERVPDATGEDATVGLNSVTSAARATLPLVSRWAGIAAGLMGAADIIGNWGTSTPARGAASGSALGATIGTCISPGAGTVVGAAVGSMFGGLLGCIKTGKHRDQKVRDAVRSFLVERGILAADYSIGLADGSRFDIGRDGSPKKGLGGRRPFEVDTSNPLAKYAISWMNPVVALLSQGNQKVQSDFVGYLANAAMSNAHDMHDLKANTDVILRQFGVDDNVLVDAILQAASSGLIDESVAQAYVNGIAERLSFQSTTEDKPGE